MAKKKIIWLTPDYFVDVDLPIIPVLLGTYNIIWIIQFGLVNRFSEKEFDELKKLKGLTVEFFYVKHSGKDPRQISDFMKLWKKMLALYADLYYINLPPLKPFSLPFYKLLPKDKTVVTAHDGCIKSIMRPTWLYRWCFRNGYGMVNYVQMFSKSQAAEFEKLLPRHNVTVIPLALKDYGTPILEKRTDCISFLSFGTMHAEKNIGLLIDAADQLYDEGVRGFKVSINGSWNENWNINERIKHLELFELSIGMVPNENIPDLFARNHYAVLPYKMMSQSGAIKVAFNYHNPVIVSNLKGFTDEVKNATDGYIFKSEDLEDLKRVMRKCIVDGIEGYETLRSRMQTHIDEVYSTPVLAEAYKKMFNKILER